MVSLGIFLVLDSRFSATTLGCRFRSATRFVDRKIVPEDWWAITTGPIVRVRWPHMLLAAFLTTGMCVAATGAWYLLRGKDVREAGAMLRWGLGFVAVVIPIQMVFGHLTGILSKLNEAGWAIVSVIVLCCFLAGLHRPVTLVARFNHFERIW